MTGCFELGGVCVCGWACLMTGYFYTVGTNVRVHRASKDRKDIRQALSRLHILLTSMQKAHLVLLAALPSPNVSWAAPMTPFRD